jgi:hypothetical protein
VESVRFDPRNGIFVDVALAPFGDEETVRFSAPYAGGGFGFYAPLETDDEVLVVFPSGDPNEGGIVVSRLWSAADPPPTEAGSGEEASSNVALRTKTGRKLIIRSNNENIEVVAEGTGLILLGADNATRGAARLNDEVDLGYWITERNGDKDITWWRLTQSDAWQQIDDVTVPPIFTDIGTHLIGKIRTASTKVKVEG